jgi:CHAT domain-containing protein/Flp pilus assembly protein TadD
MFQHLLITLLLLPGLSNSTIPLAKLPQPLQGQIIAKTQTHQKVENHAEGLWLLTPEQVVERSLSPGETHNYQIDLNAGEYLHLIAEQLGVDLEITLFSPDGHPWVKRDRTYHYGSKESIHWIAETAGNYRVEVRRYQQTRETATYQLKIADLHRATATDRQRVSAEQLSQEGDRLYQQRTREAYQASLEKYQTALTIYQELGDRLQASVVRIWIGNVHKELYQYQIALEDYHQALTGFQETNEFYYQAFALTQLGRVYQLLGNYQQALEFYQQALPFREKIRDRLGVARNLTYLGNIYQRFGDYQQALNYYQRSLSLRRELRDRKGEANTLNNLGLVYWHLGDNPQALDYYQQALTIQQELKNIRAQAIILNNIGNVYRSLADTEQALNYLNQALPLRRQVSDRRGEAATLHNLGKVYSNAGETESALDYFHQSLEIDREVGNTLGIAYNLMNLGTIYIDRGQIDQALNYYHQALPLWQKMGGSNGEAEVLYGIARVESQRGNLEIAIARIETALAIVEEIRTNVVSPDLRTSFLAAKQNYYELYINLLMQLHSQQPNSGYDALALQASEKARARSLLDILTEAQANIRQGVHPQLLERERFLTQQLKALETQSLELFNRETTAENQAIADQIDLNREKYLNQYRLLQSEIRANSPRYAALTQPQPLTVPEIQAQVLDEDTLLLEYFLGEEQSYLWAVTSEEISSYQLPSRQIIEQVAINFRNTVTSPVTRTNLTKVAKSAKSLTEIILSPVANDLGETFGKKRLVIVADGALQYVPFAAVAVPGTASTAQDYLPLMVNHEIITLPSASTQGILREELRDRPLAPKTLAVFADPVFGLSDDRVNLSETQKKQSLRNLYARLPFTRQEAEVILGMVPESDRISAFDFAANREQVFSEQLSQYKIVHFATHGEVDTEQPELSTLILSLVDETGEAQNGFLRLHDIFNLNLPAELVVLSACQTGLGKNIRGEGVIGLTRGFMYAGAARVVVSLWYIDDEATADLMVKFYEQMLQKNLTPAAALQAAQVEMWQEQKWRSPYYWAAFTLQGEWQ